MENNPETIKQRVREGYGKIAAANSSCCSSHSCCGSGQARTISQTVGYSADEMDAVPENANLGLGCGNPVALASLKEGDMVLDLGSGAGFDAFLAARKVGPKGRVIGVDMTPEMIAKARANAVRGGYSNVEFRQGEIEKLPVEDGLADVIISNCVINLSPEKDRVFKEAFRVLKPGGRLMVSDLVLVRELPASIRESVEAYVGCLAGAIRKDDYLNHIKSAGFSDVRVVAEDFYPVAAMANDATAQVIKSHPLVTEEDIGNTENTIASIKVYARKETK